MLPSLPVMVASMLYRMMVWSPASASSVAAVAVSRPTTPSGVPSTLASMRVGRLDPRHLHIHFEGEAHIGDAGRKQRAVMRGVDGVELLHAVDAGGEELRVAQAAEHKLARRLHADFAFDFHDGPGRSSCSNSSAAQHALPRPTMVADMNGEHNAVNPRRVILLIGL